MTRPRSEHSDRTDPRGDPGDGVTVATHFARPLARALRRLGVAPGRVLGALARKELPPRIPYRDAAAAWQAAVAATDEPAIGVLASACLVAGDYGLIEYLARSSATLRIAAERLGRYHRLMNDRADAQLSTRGGLGAGQVRLRYVGPSTLAMPRAYVEYVIGAWVRLAREATDEPRVVLAVHLPFPAPRDRRPYRDAFGATIAFGRPHADVLLDATIVDRPLVGADTHVTAMLERHAEAVLASYAPAAEWHRKVSDALRPRLADGPPRLATIAATLGETARALRRRLATEGTTFAALLDDLRRSLALQMVDDPTLSIGEIAFVLGFSEASAFHRAFRRWTGRTPRPAAVARARHA
jgi:AraC-like DNA-binding protein